MRDYSFNIGIGRAWEFVVDHPGDNTGDASTALQTAHDLAAAKKGVMIIPPGEFPFTATLALDPTVEVQGSGMRGTKLIKSGTGAAMAYINTATVFARPKPIHQFWLQGVDAAGSIGLNFQGIAGFDLNNSIITKFKTAIKLVASLMGDITQCELTFNERALVGELATQTTEGFMQSNHVRLRSVFMARNTGVALEWSDAALISLIGCGFEYNGVNGDANTGCMKFNQASRSNEGIGFSLTDNWIERNWGTIFNLPEPYGDTVHTVNNSLVAFNEQASNVAQITGNTKKNTLRFTNTPVHTNGTAGIVTTGANASVQYSPVPAT